MERPVSLMKWLFLPPVVAIPTILIVRSLGSPAASGPVDASLWGLTGLLFVVLTALYALFILQGRQGGVHPGSTHRAGAVALSPVRQLQGPARNYA